MGTHAYCSEACAVISLADEASRTSWRLTAQQLRRARRDLRGAVRLLLARWSERLAQRRLDRRLDAGPHAQALPWIWLPPGRTAAVLVLALAAWGAAQRPAPETPVIMAPASAPSAPSLAGPSPPPAASMALVPSAPPSEPVASRASVSALRAAPSVPPAPLHQQAVFRNAGADLTRGNRSVREVAFTFDGGDEANVTEEILSILRARGIHATMFLTGQFILMHLATHRQTDRPHESLPEILQRLQDAGYRLVTISGLVGHLEPRQVWTVPSAEPAAGASAVVR